FFPCTPFPAADTSPEPRDCWRTSSAHSRPSHRHCAASDSANTDRTPCCLQEGHLCTFPYVRRNWEILQRKPEYFLPFADQDSAIATSALRKQHRTSADQDSEQEQE